MGAVTAQGRNPSRLSDFMLMTCRDGLFDGEIAASNSSNFVDKTFVIE